MSRNIIKIAEIGGTGNRQSFEKIVADLSYRYIKDNAPSLIQYEQGFQLLEKSDDDTKAVGIVGFNVNQMQIYCPVFFLNGEIKGNELMYLADQDLFVPVKEAWLNKIMGKKPIIIGEGIRKDRHRRGYSSPDLSVFKDAPTKISSVKYPDWVYPGLKGICRIIGGSLQKSASNMIDMYRDLRQSLDIRPFVQLADARGVYHLKEAIAKAPLIKQAFTACYGNSDFLDKVYNYKEAKDQEFKLLSGTTSRTTPDGKPVSSLVDDMSWIPDYVKNPIYKQADYVSVISYTEVINKGAPFTLSQDEKERLSHDGYLVSDSRKDHQVSKLVKKESKSLINPTEMGLYDVLMHDGTTEKRICIPANDTSVRDSNIKRSYHYFLIDPETGNCSTRAKNKIWCSKIRERIPAGKLRKVSADGMTFPDYVFIFYNNQCIGPVDCDKTLGDTIICKPCYAFDSPRKPLSMTDIESIKITPRGSALRAIDETTLQVPEDAKFLAVYGNNQHGFGIYGEEDKKYGDLDLLKVASASATEDVKLYVNGESCYINGRHQDNAFQGFCSLIKDFGLREKVAANLMREAAGAYNNDNTIRFTIKRAEPLDYGNATSIPFPYDQSSQAGNIMGGPLPLAASNTSVYEHPTSAYSPGTGPYDYTLDPAFPAQDAQNIMQAAQSGQQEVFDVSMLKQLITNVNTGDQIDALSSKLVRAMDNAGRLLFLFYWKGDQFQEIYGPQELPELEGGLRKTFEALGDLVLFLQRKSTEPITYSGESAINPAEIED